MDSIQTVNDENEVKRSLKNAVRIFLNQDENPDPNTLQGLYQLGMEINDNQSLILLGSLVEKCMLSDWAFNFGDPMRRTQEADPDATYSGRDKIEYENYTKAKSLYSKAKENGHKDASFLLGRLMYTGWLNENGTFIEEQAEATVHLELAAREHHSDGLLWMGCLLVEANQRKIFKSRARWLFSYSSKKGNAAATYSLAVLYATKATRSVQNCRRGYFWNEDGLESATGLIGSSPYFELDPREYMENAAHFPIFKELFNRAAKRGHTRAMLEIGIIFQHGFLGENKNLPIAAAWYERAKRETPTNSTGASLNILNREMENVEPDFAALSNMCFFVPPQRN